MIGYGAVARSVLPIFFKHIKVSYKNITIVDFIDRKKELKDWIGKGIRFVQQRITSQNLIRIVSNYVNPGGIIIDLAWNIDCIDIIQWAHNNNVLYLNASVEEWDPYSEIHTKSSLEKSLYYRYMKILEMSSTWNHSVTAVIDHGANPGLISHFVKKGIVDIAKKVIKDKKMPARDLKIMERFVEDEEFARLAMKLGIKVIHCSEKDTQITNKPKNVDEFVGMWGIEGMIEESISPVEIGWGIHEKELPKLASFPSYGTKNQIIVPQMGMNTWVRSWAPYQEFVGMIITHGETFGISQNLTLKKANKIFYRPTVLYAYLPSNETISSLHELRCRNYELQPKLRIMNDEITSGTDTLGALIMGHPYNSWWTGSVLSIDESRRLVPHQNATTVQVGIGVVSAVLWMLDNTEKGLCFPEDLPYEYILSVAKPYLGDFVSEPVDWTPLKNYQVFFKENLDAQPDRNNIWRLKNFIFKP